MTIDQELLKEADEVVISISISTEGCNFVIVLYQTKKIHLAPNLAAGQDLIIIDNISYFSIMYLLYTYFT